MMRKRRPRTGAWQAAIFVAAAVALLASTTVVSNARFQFGETAVLHNTDFRDGLTAWRQNTPDQIRLEAGDPPVVRLEHRARPGSARLSQELAPGPRLSYVRVTANARVEDVAIGTKPWHTARIVAAPFDADGNYIPGRPHVLLSETGTGGWHRHDAVFPIGGDVATISVELQLLAKAGAMEVSGIRVQEAFEMPGFAAIHRALGVGWAVLVFVALVWLSRRLPKRGLWVCIALAIAVIVLTAPRPRDHVIRPVLIDRFIDAAALKPYLPSLGSEQAPARAPRQTPAPEAAPAAGEAEPGGQAEVLETWNQIVEWIRQFDHLDEYMHALFLFLVAFVCLAIAGLDGIALVGAALVVLALVSEFLQVFSLGRSFSLGDAGYNLIGVAAGLALYLLGRRAVLLTRPSRP